MYLIILVCMPLVPALIVLAYALITDSKDKKENPTPNRSALLQEIETLPADCIGEVEDFVSWIKHHKSSKTTETALLSEKALAKDLDTTEDKAWVSLEKAV